MHYYKNKRDIKTKDAENPERIDRTDQLSYVSVENQVKNFIASGQAVTSLRHTQIQVQQEEQKTLEDVLSKPMNEFERHIYGMDITEAYTIIRAWDRKNLDKEKAKREEQDKIDRIKNRIKELSEKEKIKGE